MGLSGNQKAIMYALGGVARGGATRGGYHSSLPFISIGGSLSRQRRRRVSSSPT